MRAHGSLVTDGKPFQEGFNRLTRLNVFDEGLHRNASTCEYWSSSEDFGRGSNDPRGHRNPWYAKTNPVTTVESYNRIAKCAQLGYCLLPAAPHLRHQFFIGHRVGYR